MSLLFSVILIITLSACSNSSPVVYYDNFDFSQVKNYSFYGNDSAFFESQNLNYAQRSRIELAIENKLGEQSLSYSEIDQADMVVTYYIVDQSSRHYLAYNKIVRFCGYCLESDLWIKENSNLKVFPGGLIIDLIDPSNNRSVWRSIYPLKMKEKDNSNKLNAKLIDAVNIMLSQYPN